MTFYRVVLTKWSFTGLLWIKMLFAMRLGCFTQQPVSIIIFSETAHGKQIGSGRGALWKRGFGVLQQLDLHELGCTCALL